MVSYSSSENAVPKYSLNSDIGVRARTENSRSLSRLIVLVILDVVLVVDFADDLLDHILDGHQPAYAAVLIHHHGQMIVAHAKFLEQHVEPLAFGHEHDGAHELADLERLAVRDLQAQQILGEQDAENLIAVLADDRKAGMTRLDHELDQFIGRLVALDENHLGARHHDVPHLHVGHRQHALEHDQRIAVEQPALARLAQILDQLGEVARLARHRLRDPL